MRRYQNPSPEVQMTLSPSGSSRTPVARTSVRLLANGALAIMVGFGALVAMGGPASADMKLAIDSYNSRDFEDAFVEFKRMAELGDAKAQNWLAELYFFGQGGEQNYVESFRWYTAASDQGDVTAIRNLAYMYEMGLGIEADAEIAIRLYETADKLEGSSAMNGSFDLGALILK